jgi:hypothetical protein
MKRKVLLLLLTVFMLSFSNNSNAQVSLIGVGATGDWATDQDMVDGGGGMWTLVDYVMPGGEFKFRLNHDWATAWGNGLGTATFPVGIADTTPGPTTNITAVAGTYAITFNQNTGEFSFSGAAISTVKLVGTAVTTVGGVVFSTLDADNYTATNVTTVAGTAQFEVDGTSLSGATDFPIGEAIDPVALIPVPAGTWSSISFNLSSGHYEFVAAPLNPPVSIVGSAVGGWPGDPGNLGPIDTNQMTSTNADGEHYTFNALAVTSGGLKFRKDNAWTVSWGGVAFPVGPTVGSEGSDILVVAGQEGTYDVSFTRSTGAYAFSFPTIAVVGSAVGGWPGDPGNLGPIDVHQMTTTDGLTYSITGLSVTAGGLKFRKGNAWTTSWGGVAFPTGPTVGSEGSDILVVAGQEGTYDVTLNRVTGAYGFTLLATKGFSTSNFKVYPNPTNNNWNFSSVKESIQSIQIVDVLGKTVMTVNPNNTAAIVDASALNAGIYFAKIATATANQTIKLMKN